MASISLFPLLLLFLWINPIRTVQDYGPMDYESSEEVVLRRSFLKKLLGMQQRETEDDGPADKTPSDTVEFTEEQRKFQQDALETHNILRARHCSPPLVLDDEINVRSQIYAEILASNDSRLIHSTDRMGLFGENLYAVTRSRPITTLDGKVFITDCERSSNLPQISLLADKVVRTWYTEIALYDYNKPGYSRNTGHFSQIVWKNTKRLGVGYAFAREGRKLYVVNQYGPPGNYGFAYRDNVLPPTCGE